MHMLAQLWLPILLSAVVIFLASSLIHMIFKWHNSDYHGLPDEESVRAALGQNPPAPGQYFLPYTPDMKDREKPEVVKKWTEGPVAFLVVSPNGLPAMGKALGLWFLYAIAVAFMAAYVAAATLPAGTHYLRVFRVVGTVSFLTFAGGSVQGGIWWGKPWKTVCKDVVDGLIYGLLTAGVFGWLWPR
ncbi:MAG TPA: hypothetical protein VJ486_08085 [Geothrix sp.]|nr:hypothetical protein [Geothrix sp.]